MDTLLVLKDFVAALRGGDYLGAARLAARLLQVGVDLWSEWRGLRTSTSGPDSVAWVLPCNVEDDGCVADWCEAQCKVLVAGVPGISAAGAMPWNLLLPLLVKVLERLLSR